MPRNSGLTQQEYREVQDWRWNGIFAILGFLVGAAALQAYFDTGFSAICYGSIRIEHFNLAIPLMVLGLFIIVLSASNPKWAKIQGFGFFIFALGGGILADDFLQHYVYSWNPFSYTQGCS